MNDQADIVRMAIEEIWNQGKLNLADELFASDYVNHGGLIPDLVRGPEAMKISVVLYRLAFPRLLVVVKDLFVEDDLVVLHWATRNTDSNDAMESVSLAGVTMSRCAGLQIAESWTFWDSEEFPSQLGRFVRPNTHQGTIQG